MIMASARVGNDGLLYVWYALGLGCVFYWYLYDKNLYFWGALVSGLLAVATKMTGMLLLVTIMLAVIIKMLDKRSLKKQIGSLLVVILFIVIGAVIPLLRTLPGYLAGDLPSFITPNVNNLDTQLRVVNNWEHFLGFDFDAYRQPYIHASRDETGRQYFWNFMLKTSLFSEFELRPVELAKVEGWMLLGIVVCLVLASVMLLTTCWLMGCDQRRGFWGLVFLAALVLMGGSVGDRLIHPFSCSGDFRYIAPILIPLGMIWFGGVEILRKKGMIFFPALVNSLLVLFTLFSIVLVLSSFEGFQF